MDLLACPVCATVFGNAWWLLGRRASGNEPIATHVCPECTLACTGRPSFRTDAGYRARVWSVDPSTRVEDDDGQVRPASIEHRHALELARVADLRRALGAVRSRRRLRALQVGVRDGGLLQAARRGLRVNAVALEPWAPWANAARATDNDVHQSTLEDWRKRGAFDLIVEHDLLPHLSDPMAHLRAIASRLAPDGVALIEVPNLLQAVGATGEDVLSTARPFWFTPRALVTACRRAGLAAFHLETDQRLRVMCRPAPPVAITVPGTSAEDVVEVVRGNDVRLSLKRALFRAGATPVAIHLASTIHARCTRPALRADLAIEIATACERGSDFDAAAHWLMVAQQDRYDPEVSATLDTLERVRDRVRTMWTPIDEEPQGLRLAS
jgi:SAM-dependent methyltransferase